MQTVQINFEVEEDFRKTLKDLAEQEDRTLKAFIVRALKDAIANRGVKA